MSVVAIRFPPSLEEKARLLSKEFSVPLESENPKAEVVVEVGEAKYSLMDAEGRRLDLDFESTNFYQRKGHKGKSELLVRALGVKAQDSLIFDLSGGFLIDSVFLAKLGFRVHTFERNPTVYMVMNAVLQSCEQKFAQNIRFDHLDALRACEKFFAVEKPEALYFDPMFPEKKKSLSKLPMQIFQSLVGGDEDSAEVILEVMKKYPCRTVIKRPLKAPELIKNPKHSFVGNTVRYDMYV
ncbi:MAG: class I SAM-dependent methyltransferase [Pseudobdellovibrionaceae bacterium]